VKNSKTPPENEIFLNMTVSTKMLLLPEIKRKLYLINHYSSMLHRTVSLEIDAFCKSNQISEMYPIIFRHYVRLIQYAYRS
jgi:hypothetical protein